MQPSGTIRGPGRLRAVRGLVVFAMDSPRRVTIVEPERDPVAQAAAPLDVNLAVAYRPWRFGDAIVRARAARSWSGAGTRLPIYRELRWAVRAKLDALFDDIASQSGVDAHRLDEGLVVLDGPGLFVYASGTWKGSYSSFIAEVWAASSARADELREALSQVIGARCIRAVADGVVRAQGRKMIFTTNLPNLSDIDEALLRPGRCFASVRVRALSRMKWSRS